MMSKRRSLRPRRGVGGNDQMEVNLPFTGGQNENLSDGQSAVFCQKLEELGARMEAIFSSQQQAIDQINQRLERPYSSGSEISDFSTTSVRRASKQSRGKSRSPPPKRSQKNRSPDRSPVKRSQSQKATTDGLRFAGNKEQVKFLSELEETVDEAQVLLEGGGSRSEVSEILKHLVKLIRKKENAVRILDSFGYNVHRLYSAGSSLDLSPEEKSRLQAAICAQSIPGSTVMGRGQHAAAGPV